MNRRPALALVALAAAVSLTACGSGPTADPAAQFVRDRFGACITKVGDDPGGAASAGRQEGAEGAVVLVQVPGPQPLTFYVIENNAGPTDALGDEATNAAFAQAGCA